MRYFLILFIVIASVTMGGIELDAARFDWSLGQPTITDDNDNSTHGTRYDWSLGQPTIVREEETPVVSAAEGFEDIMWIYSDW